MFNKLWQYRREALSPRIQNFEPKDKSFEILLFLYVANTSPLKMEMPIFQIKIVSSNFQTVDTNSITGKVRTHFASIIAWNSRKMITETPSYIFSFAVCGTSLSSLTLV